MGCKMPWWAGSETPPPDKDKIIADLRAEVASLKEQNALLTVQVQRLETAIAPLARCHLPPDGCEHLGVTAHFYTGEVVAAKAALSDLPQSEDVRDAARYRHVRSGILNCSFIVRQARYDGKWVEMGCDVLDEAIDAAMSAQD